jgi:hypothetical protein
VPSCLRAFSSYAASATPPARLALIGADTGPFSKRGLNQQAQTHTKAPGATLASNATSKVALVLLPSLFQSVRLAGGSPRRD